MSLPQPVTSPTMPPSKGNAPLRLNSCRIKRPLLMRFNCEQKLQGTSAFQKMRCNTSARTSTRASINPSSRATSSSITYAHPSPLHARAVGNRGPDVRHTVECIRRAPAAVDCAEPRHVIRLLFHPGERGAPRGLHTGFGRTSALMGILQLRLWHVDVLHHGQRRWKASASNRHIEPPRRTF
jgi:hypothetical protein